MDEQHKKVLQRNRVSLVKELDPSGLYDKLLEKGVFTSDMIDEIKRSGTRRDQARQLVRDLETRGSRAFPLFLESLRESEQNTLAELLQSAAVAIRIQPNTPTSRPVLQPLPVSSPMDINTKNQDVLPVHPLPNITPSSSPENEPFRPRLYSRTRRDSIQGYKMDASPCGLCLIINNMEFEPQSNLKNRKGSNIDSEKLERRFKALNFSVEVKTNLKHKQIKQELAALSKTDHSQYDCCVVIILSHGTEVSHSRFPGAVYGVDGAFVTVQYITTSLNGQHCPSLQGKPKVFFIQACGGDEKDIGFEVSAEEESQLPISERGDETDAISTSSSSDSLSVTDETDSRSTLPTPSDILVSYSTFPGYVSWRDTESGSWYVETLDRVLEENAATDDLATILMMVNNEVSQNSAKGVYKQMPGSFNFLRKLVYFQTSEQEKTSTN